LRFSAVFLLRATLADFAAAAWAAHLQRRKHEHVEAEPQQQ